MLWRVLILMVTSPFFTAALFADMPSLVGASTNRVLMIDRSSTTVSGAKATLIIDALRFTNTNDIFAGHFHMKVVPFFFKNEKGNLAITITPECFAKASQGLKVDITGTATTDGKNGITRQIDAIATPLDNDHGDLKLWFMVDERKLTFETHYRFVEAKSD